VKLSSKGGGGGAESHRNQRQEAAGKGPLREGTGHFSGGHGEKSERVTHDLGHRVLKKEKEAPIKKTNCKRSTKGAPVWRRHDKTGTFKGSRGVFAGRKKENTPGTGSPFGQNDLLNCHKTKHRTVRKKETKRDQYRPQQHGNRWRIKTR